MFNYFTFNTINNFIFVISMKFRLIIHKIHGNSMYNRPTDSHQTLMFGDLESMLD